MRGATRSDDCVQNIETAQGAYTCDIRHDISRQSLMNVVPGYVVDAELFRDHPDTGPF
jgi:hypothetical protein